MTYIYHLRQREIVFYNSLVKHIFNKLPKVQYLRTSRRVEKQVFEIFLLLHKVHGVKFVDECFL